jgi:DNA polymerase-3 subunit chi
MEIQFYHLLSTPLEVALPKLLPKVLAGGFTTLIKCRDAAQMKQLDEKIWVQDAESFLPHGLASEAHSEDQPILLSLDLQPLNQATLLIILDGTLVSAEQQSSFTRILDMFDGTHEPTTLAARERWKTYKSQGHTLSYIKQQPDGGWKKEA